MAAALTAATTQAQTTTTTTAPSFAPENFGNRIFTATPSNATSSVGVSSVFGSDGTTSTFGTGGALVNPTEFDYAVTGPNTATISTPASDSTPAATTNLTFTSESQGTYATTSEGDTTTGTFSLSEIPSAPPLSNLSVRTNLDAGESTTVGFFVAGTMPRQVLVRAIGPGLESFGVSNGLANPSLTLFQGTQAMARNDDWGTVTGTGTDTGAAGGSDGLGTGTGGAGDDTGIGGTSTRGDGTETGGTGLGGSGGTATTPVTTSPADAEMFGQLGAFALTNGSRDSAIVATLPPGAYTVVVSNSTAGASGTGGTGTGTGTVGTGTGTGGNGTGGTDAGGTSATGSGEVLVEVYFVE